MEQNGTEWNTFFAESPSGPPASPERPRYATSPCISYPIAEVVESKVEGPFAASISSEKWPHEKTLRPIGRQDGHRPVGVRSGGIDRLQRTSHAGPTATDAAADQTTPAQVAVTTVSGPEVDSSPATEPTAKVTTAKNPAAEQQPPVQPVKTNNPGPTDDSVPADGQPVQVATVLAPRCLMPSTPR